MDKVVNFAAFQVGWLACVLGGAHDMPWLGPAVVALVVAYHLQRAAVPGRELTLILVAGLIGALWDSLLVTFAGFDYASGTLAPGTAPYWIVAMWLLFATTLNVSLRWLRERWRLAALFGALGGPLAYYAGARLGALGFADLPLAMTALALGWAALVPLLMALARRWDGMLAAPGNGCPARGVGAVDHV